MMKLLSDVTPPHSSTSGNMFTFSLAGTTKSPLEDTSVAQHTLGSETASKGRVPPKSCQSDDLITCHPKSRRSLSQDATKVYLYPWRSQRVVVRATAYNAKDLSGK